MQTHEQYVDEWRAMYQKETGSDALGAELAYESVAGMSDCQCEECLAWEKASWYAHNAFNEPRGTGKDKKFWEFVEAIETLAGKSGD